MTICGSRLTNKKIENKINFSRRICSASVITSPISLHTLNQCAHTQKLGDRIFILLPHLQALHCQVCTQHLQNKNKRQVLLLFICARVRVEY